MPIDAIVESHVGIIAVNVLDKLYAALWREASPSSPEALVS